ncbi:MAG: hypothetical protein KDD84_16005 [Caldilineaceae bacterium]|nr:hypothetical protein [Caldilineaceae bacterium]
MHSADPSYGDVTDLTTWRQTIDRLLAQNRPGAALRLLPVILQQLPHYLPAFRQMLHALWQARRWRDGQPWALRLLRADPSQELAWAVLANVAEEVGNPSMAHRFWLLAFEQAPYNRQVRSGVVRTALTHGTPLALNQAALATLYRHGGHWAEAATIYASLTAAHPDRPDLQNGYLESLWQSGQTDAAVDVAHDLAIREPQWLLAWLVSAEIGDADDHALAQAPLAALDADGAYVANRYGIQMIHTAPPLLTVTPKEARLFARLSQQMDIA